jgi:hypothetical protein
LTVAGLKLVAVGEQSRTKVATGSFGEILGIEHEHDNEHDWERSSFRIGRSSLSKRSIRPVSIAFPESCSSSSFDRYWFEAGRCGKRDVNKGSHGFFW